VIHFTLPYPPTTGNHTTGTNVGRHYTDPRIVEYRRIVWLRWVNMKRPHIDGPVSIAWRVTTPDARRRDWDNCRKVIMDAISPPLKPSNQRASFIDGDHMAVIRAESMVYLGASKTNAGVEIVIDGIANEEGK
jgi:hypothetical protein